jgi:hypothetical protein
MATYKFGDYWTEYHLSDLFLFTSNGVINGDRLVMGAGTARQVRDEFPGIDQKIGRVILDRAYPEIQPNVYSYGLLINDRWPKSKGGAFQTKYHWRDNSDLDLIFESMLLLKEWCEKYPDARVDLPMPGVGCGKLSIAEVKEITDHLPDQVNVWTL